jgi:hypothetical protein
MRFSPETFNILEGHEPVESDAIAGTCNEVCLKNADGVWIIVHEDYAADATPLVITIHLGATAAEALAGTTVLASDFPAWLCAHGPTTDAMVRQTDAATYTLDPGAAGNNALWAFYIPAALLAAGNYSWIQPDFAAGNNGNIASVLYILDRPRYQQETPPSAI